MNSLITTIGFIVMSSAAFLSGWMWQKELSHRKGFNQGLHVNYLNKKLPEQTSELPTISLLKRKTISDYCAEEIQILSRAWSYQEAKQGFDELYQKEFVLTPKK